jgi:hypothetical protein
MLRGSLGKTRVEVNRYAYNPRVSSGARPFARPLLRFLGAGVFVAGAYMSATSAPASSGQHRLSTDYPQAAPGWAMAAAVGAGLAALGLARGARLAAVGVVLVALVFAAHLARYRVAVEDAGLSERGLLGTKTLAWRDVARVESGSRLVVVWGRADEQGIDASVSRKSRRAWIGRSRDGPRGSTLHR